LRPGGLDNAVSGADDKEWEKSMAEIRQAITHADVPRLRRAAHTLRGSADSFSAVPVVEAAPRLELIGRDGNLVHAEEACQALEKEMSRLIPALAPYAVNGAS